MTCRRVSHDAAHYVNVCPLHLQVMPRLSSFRDTAQDIISVQDNLLDIEKVRLIVVWISLQKIRTRQYGPDAKDGTPLGYMRQIKEGKGTFAGLLAKLCR